MSVPHTRQGPLPEPHDLVAAWRSGDAATRAALASQHASAVDESYAKKLKALADHALRNDLRECLDIADLLLALGEANGVAPIVALGLLTRANGIGIGHGDYAAAIPDYETAADLYLGLDRPVDAARSRIGQVYALSVVQSFADAERLGTDAVSVLQAAKAWGPVVDMYSNLAGVSGRRGDDQRALTYLDAARQTCVEAGSDLNAQLVRVDINRSIVLRNLGQFDESLACAKAAGELAKTLGIKVAVAYAAECQGVTSALMGHYTQAAVLFEQALDTLKEDGRQRNAALVELSAAETYLRLGQFDPALEHVENAKASFQKLGGRVELAQTSMLAAEVMEARGQFAEAEAEIDRAHALFVEDNAETLALTAEVARAHVLLVQNRLQESLTVALACGSALADRSQLRHATQANLIAATAAHLSGQPGLAISLANDVLARSKETGLAGYSDRAYQVLGQIAQHAGDLPSALKYYEDAIREMELQRGQIMIEYRSSFLTDKQSLYEDMVDACVQAGRASTGLSYTDRAKSRALVDLFEYRINLSLQPQDADDQALIDDIQSLRLERDSLIRRSQADLLPYMRGPAGAELAGSEAVVALERRITALWHKLLTRNADYARDADLWHVDSVDLDLRHIPPTSLLVEYMAIHGRFVAFVAHSNGIEAYRLGASLDDVRLLQRQLALHLDTAMLQASEGRPLSSKATLAVLQRLYTTLVAPWASHLNGVDELTIVPHGLLHYLPFSALHDGRAHIIQNHTIRISPNASLLKYVSAAPDMESPIAVPWGAEVAAVGYSMNGQLPEAPREAERVAELFGGRPLLELEATSDAIRTIASQVRLLHLATHAEFRADNPLFSGLALADRWLTTLDLFNWRTSASLVTLSACQTGKGVIGGGDEVLGLLRALLYAGARSIVASLWPVQDQVTSRFMTELYTHLAAGKPKAKALQTAQLAVLDSSWSHPYFWAPFFLVGDASRL